MNDSHEIYNRISFQNLGKLVRNSIGNPVRNLVLPNLSIRISVGTTVRGILINPILLPIRLITDIKLKQL